MIRAALFPRRPLRAGLTCALGSITLIVAAIYLPAPLATATALLLAGIAAFMAQIWFLYGPPWRAAQ